MNKYEQIKQLKLEKRILELEKEILEFKRNNGYYPCYFHPEKYQRYLNNPSTFNPSSPIY